MQRLVLAILGVGSICTLCDATAKLELTSITPEELTQGISGEHDPLLVLFYVRWATKATEAMRSTINEASKLFDSDNIKLAEMDVSDFGASYSSFKFTENHHIDEAPSVFLYVDGAQYHYTGGARPKPLIDFVAGGGFSTKKKQSIDVSTEAMIEEEYARREASDAVDSLQALTRFNFDTELVDGSDWLVHFFLPLRQESTTLFGPLRKVASIFEKEDLDVKVAQVHMAEKTVADWAGITKVPAVVFMSEGRMYDFPGLSASRVIKDPPRTLDFLSFVDGGFAMTKPRIPGLKVEDTPPTREATESDSGDESAPSDMDLRMRELKADALDFVNDLTRDITILYRSDFDVVAAIAAVGFTFGTVFGLSRFRSLLKNQ